MASSSSSDVYDEQVALCDEQILNENEIHYTTNKIGGVPCNNCNAKMVLITQLYCPFVEATYHRIIYLMACVNRACWNKADSWCAYRSQVQDFDYLKQLAEEKEAASHKNEPKQQSEPIFSTSDWASGASEWSNGDDGITGAGDNNSIVDYDDDDGMAIANDWRQSPTSSVPSSFKNNYIAGASLEDCMGNLDLSSSDSDLSLNDTASARNPAFINETINEAFTQWKQTINGLTKSPTITFDTNRAYFEGYFLNVLNKSYFKANDQNNNRSKSSKNQYNCENVDDTSYSKPEAYEKTNLKHGDKLFYKFRKSIDFCPHQAVRYARNSKPLFIAKHDDFKLDTMRCTYCNAQCVYEFQLMPALVNYLKPIESKYNSIEFGTVIIYSCEKSCWSDTDMFRVEHVYVQADPDEKLFS